MVSGSQVSSDASALSSTLNSITTNISSFSGAWKGDSFDNLNNKVSEFVSEFSGKIVEQMGNFAEACNLYEKYIQLKEKLKTLKANLKTLQQNYEEAVKADDSSKAASYSQQISETTEDIADTKQQMQEIKQQIESLLSEVTGVKLKADSKNYSAGEKVDYTDNANFSYFDQSTDYRSYAFSSGNPDTLESGGCAPTSLAMVLNSLGFEQDPYTVGKWLTNNGFHKEGIGTTGGWIEAYDEAHPSVEVNHVDSRDEFVSALENGDMMVINGAAGTNLGNSYGHFLVIRGYGDSKNEALIADPYGNQHSGSVDIDSIRSQLNDAWIVRKS